MRNTHSHPEPGQGYTLRLPVCPVATNPCRNAKFKSSLCSGSVTCCCSLLSLVLHRDLSCEIPANRLLAARVSYLRSGLHQSDGHTPCSPPVSLLPAWEPESRTAGPCCDSPHPQIAVRRGSLLSQAPSSETATLSVSMQEPELSLEALIAISFFLSGCGINNSNNKLLNPQ